MYAESHVSTGGCRYGLHGVFSLNKRKTNLIERDDVAHSFQYE